jgi:hypothetical protein
VGGENCIMTGCILCTRIIKSRRMRWAGQVVRMGGEEERV